MKNNFFSVIITTFNRANLLTRALHSLIAQTETDWEAIVIDDGSTDDTHQQIQPILDLHPKIRYIKQSNQGTVSAKNAGITISKGRYITFLDSDDEYMPDHLESRKKILGQNPDTDFLHGGVQIIGNQYVPDRHDYTKRIHLSECVIGGTFFIRRDLLLALNGFKTLKIGNDADFFERASQTNAIILKSEDPTYIYHRESLDSITHNLC